MEETQLILFVLASLVVIITPGQDVLLVMSRAVSLGSRAGVVTASGVSVGLIGHSILASLGLGAMLMASKTLFTILKCVGAVYLFYLGVKMIFSSSRTLTISNVGAISGKRLFLTGAFSNISNPHVTIFYFAFLPQFISADSPSPALHLLALGLLFSLLTFLVKGPLGYFAGVLSTWIQAHPLVLRFIDRISGTLLIGLGVKLLLGERS